MITEGSSNINIPEENKGQIDIMLSKNCKPSGR